SDSWSAIALPNERVGMNPRLRALLRRLDGPAVEIEFRPRFCGPPRSQQRPPDREEIGRAKTDGRPSLQRRRARRDDQAAMAIRRVPSGPPADPRVEAHHADGAGIVRQVSGNRYCQSGSVTVPDLGLDKDR